MMGMFCPRCHTLVSPADARCRSCGAQIGELVESNQSVLDGLAERPRSKPAEVRRVEGAPFMPYEPRGCQMQIISDMVTALDEGRHFVMESGTGTGKTVVALAACLDHASRTGKTIVYLTRTITQSDQVMRELRSISRIRDVSGLAITGRAKSCPLFRGKADFDGISSSVLSMMCEDAREKSRRGKAGGCRYYDRVETALPQIRRYVEGEFPTSDELDAYCVKLQACPYEAKKALMRDAKVVAAPYVHILDPDIRDSLMTNLNRAGDPQGLLLVVDEAHNLVDAARESESFRIDRAMVDAAIDECSTFRGEPMVTPEVTLRRMLRAFKDAIRAVANELIPMGKDTAVIEDDFVEASVMRALELTPAGLDEAIDNAIELGESRTEKLMGEGAGKESEIQIVAEFLRSWCGSDSTRFVRTVHADRDGEYLRGYCMDPRDVSVFLNSVGGSVHMSGTLHPMDQYARSIGLGSRCTFRRYPSPFPPENRRVVYSDSLTTKWEDLRADPGMRGRLQETVADLCNAVDKNTLVFFTSYANMESMRGYLSTHVRKRTYWEEPRNPRGNASSLSAFRARRDGVMFCVMGGKFAEGIDFPGEELCFAVIVGIPYPPPSPELNAMSRLFDSRYGDGKGFLYCSSVPAQRKMRQAIGRLIRTETDRGMAVILDKRASRFARDLDAVPTGDPVGEAARFFNERCRTISDIYGTAIEYA